MATIATTKSSSECQKRSPLKYSQPPLNCFKLNWQYQNIPKTHNFFVNKKFVNQGKINFFCLNFTIVFTIYLVYLKIIWSSSERYCILGGNSFCNKNTVHFWRQFCDCSSPVVAHGQLKTSRMSKAEQSFGMHNIHAKKKKKKKKEEVEIWTNSKKEIA